MRTSSVTSKIDSTASPSGGEWGSVTIFYPRPLALLKISNLHDSKEMICREMIVTDSSDTFVVKSKLIGGGVGFPLFPRRVRSCRSFLHLDTSGA